LPWSATFSTRERSAALAAGFPAGGSFGGAAIAVASASAAASASGPASFFSRRLAVSPAAIRPSERAAARRIRATGASSASFSKGSTDAAPPCSPRTVAARSTTSQSLS
jgi:hypothetical protein